MYIIYIDQIHRNIYAHISKKASKLPNTLCILSCLQLINYDRGAALHNIPIAAERGKKSGEWKLRRLSEVWFLVLWKEPFLLIEYFFEGRFDNLRYHCGGQQESD